MWQQYKQDTHQKDPSNMTIPNNYTKTVNTYYNVYKNNFNLLQNNNSIKIMPHEYKIQQTKDQLKLWIQQIIQAQQ